MTKVIIINLDEKRKTDMGHRCFAFYAPYRVSSTKYNNALYLFLKSLNFNCCSYFSRYLMYFSVSIPTKKKKKKYPIIN